MSGDKLKVVHLTDDDLSLIHAALHNLKKGMKAVSEAGPEVDPGIRSNASKMAAQIDELQTKIVRETSPDIADHVDEIQAKAVAAKLEAHRCSCQQVFKSTGGGRQEARITNKRCVVHGRPNHLKAV